jgi:hypothetical protein
MSFDRQLPRKDIENSYVSFDRQLHQRDIENSYISFDRHRPDISSRVCPCDAFYR